MKQKQKRYSKTQEKQLFKSSSTQPQTTNPIKNITEKFIKQNYSSLPLNPQNKLTLPKEQIINRLSIQLHDKLSVDLSARRAIQQFQTDKIKRLNKIQDDIAEINRQNNYKMRLLAQMEKEYLKKIQEEIKRDDEIQVKLIRQYEKVVKEEQKIKLTKSVIKLRENQDWIVMEKQQKKLGLLQNIFEKRQIILGRNKSLDIINKKALEKQQLKKSIKQQKSVKKERSKKNADELKQMGRQFLEHAKKMQIQAIKSSIKLMDINKKSIDYLPEIKQIIKHQIENLSQPLANNSQALLKLKKKKKKGSLLRQSIPSTEKGSQNPLKQTKQVKK